MMCLLKLGRMSQANIVNGTLFPKRPKIKMEEWIQSGVIVGSLYFYMVYNHYVQRKKLSMPYTESLLETYTEDKYDGGHPATVRCCLMI